MVFDDSYDTQCDYYAITVIDAESYSSVKMSANTEIGEKPEITGMLGDVDGDGSVTIIDATYIQRKLASLAIPFEFNETIADTDEDGSVTIIDATYIQRWLANLQSNDNIGKPIE